MQLTANVYVDNTFVGANLGYVTTDEGIVMIDTPPRPTDAVKWRKEIESKGTLRYLIQTEPHDDHIIGAFFFAVPGIAHDITREAIMGADPAELLQMVAMLDPEGVPLVKNYKIKVPSITFSERLTLYLGKHSFHLIHLPGHTVGQTAVFVPEERVVFTGDNITGKVQGFLHDADPLAWLESLKRIGELEADHLVAGHGQVVDKSFLKEQKSYVQGCIDTIKEAIKKGWTKEEAIARVSLPTRYALEPSTEPVGPELLRLSVANLYDVLSRK